MKIFPDAVSKDEDGYYMIRQEDILVIIVLMFKELMSDNHNTCQNCGYYFVSSNLFESLYLVQYY